MKNENLKLTPEEVELIIRNREKAAKKNKAVTLDELDGIVQKTIDKETWPLACQFKTRAESLVKMAKQYIGHESIYDEAIEYYKIKEKGGDHWTSKCSYFELKDDGLILSASTGILSGAYVKYPFGKIAFRRQTGDPVLILNEELTGGWFTLTRTYKQPGVGFEMNASVVHNALKWQIKIVTRPASDVQPLCEYHRVLLPFYYDTSYVKQTKELIPVEKLCEEAAIWLQQYVKGQIKKSKEASKQALSLTEEILKAVNKEGGGNDRK